MTKKTVVFTGGGSAGHVTPNIALMETLQQQGWKIHYIGSTSGMEEGLVSSLNVPYTGVSSGKLRRYFSWQNFIDPFKILWGVFQSSVALFKIKPDLVFSKGGFVAFPVVLAAWLRRCPVVAHESDLSPGLANRLSFPFAKKICLTFHEGKKFFKKSNKLVVTGTPIRPALLTGDKDKARVLCGFDEALPCLLVIGGGQGANAINQVIRSGLDELCQQFQIIHLCGKGKCAPELENKKNYAQFDYLDKPLADCFALADIVVSRSGANSVYEILSLNKPHVFIPLPLKASRGDQIHNARHFEKLGVSVVLDEAQLDLASLKQALLSLSQEHSHVEEKIRALNVDSGTQRIVTIIKENVA